MINHVNSALFIYTEDTQKFQESLEQNPFGVDVSSTAFDILQKQPDLHLQGISHVVVAGSLDTIKAILQYAQKFHFSIGIIPTPGQKELIRCYSLPKNRDKLIDIALQQGSQLMDLVLCNDTIVLFKATVGRIPLVDSPGTISRFKLLTKSLKRFIGLKLLGFRFTTDGKKKIETAACGAMIVHHYEGTLASRLISHDSSFTDGMVSLVVVSPYSIMEYLKFLSKALKISVDRQRIPSTIGYIKSPAIDIESEQDLDVFIDGERATSTPLHCEVIPAAVRINIGKSIRESTPQTHPSPEELNIKNLPTGRELIKAREKTIPFFTYATRDRFKELFQALREDARLSSSYLVLMVLSTMLATVGLYLDSTPVVIGAMLLAPLMSPIVSLAMGILRNDEDMAKKSINTISIGIVLALLAAALITLLFPHKPITEEMATRLNPTLLDLAVAIIAGIAAAYTKSFREILHSLAGVGIAVALVPPLAVAGIGLGRLDYNFFMQAFLLFSTNLIGITLAATFTFRVLGYSAAVRSKRSLVYMILAMTLISIPLYMSYSSIVEKIVLEKSWTQERFLVNEKYIIVQSATVTNRKDRKMIIMNILAREPLTREDLTIFKKKIQTHFSKKLIVRINITYIP